MLLFFALRSRLVGALNPGIVITLLLPSLDVIGVDDAGGVDDSGGVCVDDDFDLLYAAIPAPVAAVPARTPPTILFAVARPPTEYLPVK